MNKQKTSKTMQENPSQNNTQNPPESTNNSVKSPLFPCYLCGKQFFVPAIYEHEEVCLKAWQEENSKLPLHKRKKLPQKEEVKFTPSGEVDFVGTFNRIWENHLAELEPCRLCGRTFAPDRLEVHQRSCKGRSEKRRGQGNSKNA